MTQGSMLGPTLFKIFLEHIYDIWPSIVTQNHPTLNITADCTVELPYSKLPYSKKNSL